MGRIGFVTLVVMAMLACAATEAMAAAAPGWECIPITAGQPVLSGGTGVAPSCGNGTTAVLAPTYVSSGVGGKPTVEFTAVISKEGNIENLQLVRGHPLLVNAAKEAVLQWKYKPTLLNGEPVEVDTTIDVIFSLNQ